MFKKETIVFEREDLNSRKDGYSKAEKAKTAGKEIENSIGMGWKEITTDILLMRNSKRPQKTLEGVKTKQGE